MATNSFDLSLPTEPVTAVLNEPSSMIVMGPPKIGKTTACALLPNALVLNLERREQSTTGMFKNIKSYEHLKQLCTVIRQAKKPYSFGILDRLDLLEEMCHLEAEKLYMKTAMGKNWITYLVDKNGNYILDAKGRKQINPTCGRVEANGSIINLPKGNGWQYVRQAFKNMITLLEQTFDHVIYIGHIKDSVLKNVESGLEENYSDLQLSGSLKHIITSHSQAIAYTHRKGTALCVNFNVEGKLAGCNIDRLEGRDITVTVKTTEGFKTNWAEIFPSIKQNNNK